MAEELESRQTADEVTRSSKELRDQLDVRGSDTAELGVERQVCLGHTAPF